MKVYDEIFTYDVNRAGGNASLALICSKDVCMDITEPNRSSQKMTTYIDAILSERQKTHGDFASCAYLAQTLKSYMVDSVHGSTLSNSQSLALEMIALKIARILNGNPNHIDDWADVAGYATLIVRELEAKPL